MNHPVPKQLQQWLSEQPPAVAEMLDRAQRLVEINRCLHHWCDEPWIRHIRLANIRDRRLVFYCSQAAALIPLRFRSQSLLDWLNQRFALDCREIEAKIRP